MRFANQINQMIQNSR